MATKNAVIVNGNPFVITDANSVAEYNRLFNETAIHATGGYKSHVNKQGFSYRGVAKDLPAQGLGKIAAQCVEGLFLIVSRGGADGKGAQTVLDAILGYAQDYSAKVREIQQNELVAQAVAMGISPANLAKFLTDNAAPVELQGSSATVPVATVTEAEAEETETEETETTEPETVVAVE